MGNNWPSLRIFIDSDVLFAGSASPNRHSASNVILQMGEIGLIEVIASKQVITEVSRNLSEKMPEALPVFHQIVKRCLRVVEDPTQEDVESFRGQADWKDVPILTAAKNTHCRYLLTFNGRDYWPDDDNLILQPGELLTRIRWMLSQLK